MGSRHGPSSFIPAPGPTPADPTSWSAAPPSPGSSHSASGPRSVGALVSQICVLCHVIVSGIGDRSVLGEFLEWFCVGMRVELVICLCGVVLEVFLCNVGVLVRLCLFWWCSVQYFVMRNCLHVVWDDLRVYLCGVWFYFISFFVVVSGGVYMLV